MQQFQRNAAVAQSLNTHVEELTRELQLLDAARSRTVARRTDALQKHVTLEPGLARQTLQAMSLNRLGAAHMQHIFPMPDNSSTARQSQAKTRNCSAMKQEAMRVTANSADEKRLHVAAAQQPQREDPPGTPARPQSAVTLDSPTLYLTPCDAALELLDESLSTADISGEHWYKPPSEAMRMNEILQWKAAQTGSAPARVLHRVSADDDILQSVNKMPDYWLTGHD